MTRRSGRNRTSRTIRATRTRRSSIAFSRSQGTKDATTTKKSKTFHLSSANARAFHRNAVRRISNSTT
jgi:hypothetical protein